MKATKITGGDIADKTVSSLPTRPTLPQAFGGKGYTATELKEAFDRLPLYIVEKFNELIDDIKCTNGSTIADAILTGLDDGHTLLALFEDIKNGSFAGYLTVADMPLSEFLLKLRVDVDKIATALNITL